MANRIDITEFLKLSQTIPVLDVRSPGEYGHAHIPVAYNLALFTDEERKIVGTLYKQEGREQAIKAGLDYFGPKMRGMVEHTEEIVLKHIKDITKADQKVVLVHCWRGGMRSEAVSWLLDLYGFKTYVLEGGYKSYRNWALRQFELPYTLQVLGGYTGSGKTALLAALKNQHLPVIDLEAIAVHKGSAFGGLDNVPRPTQEMFENILGDALYHASAAGQHIWIEDESQQIGQAKIPDALWKTMCASPLCFLDIPFEERLNNIIVHYGKYKKDDLLAAIQRIKKRLGGLNAKNAMDHLLDDNYKECFRILLNYYDKYYLKGLSYKKNVFNIAAAQVNAIENAQLLTKQKLMA